MGLSTRKEGMAWRQEEHHHSHDFFSVEVREQLRLVVIAQGPMAPCGTIGPAVAFVRRFLSDVDQTDTQEALALAGRAKPLRVRPLLRWLLRTKPRDSYNAESLPNPGFDRTPLATCCRSYVFTRLAMDHSAFLLLSCRSSSYPERGKFVMREGVCQAGCCI